MVPRPGELRRAALLIRVAEPEIQHAVHAEDAPAFLAVTALPELLGGGADIDAGKALRGAGDAREAAAQLPLHLGHDAGAVAPVRIERVILRPGHRPVVAVRRPADDALRRRPLQRPDHRAGWVRRLQRPGSACAGGGHGGRYQYGH